MTLRPPTLAECQQVRVWRNDPDVLPMLRTGYKTEAEQEAFYRDVVCNPDAHHRYYAIDRTTYAIGGAPVPAFTGLGGLTYLDRVPGSAEISLIIDPDLRGGGLGHDAVDALVDEAKRLGLTSVIGECYAGGNLAFWTAQIRRRPARLTWEWIL